MSSALSALFSGQLGRKLPLHDNEEIGWQVNLHTSSKSWRVFGWQANLQSYQLSPGGCPHMSTISGSGSVESANDTYVLRGFFPTRARGCDFSYIVLTQVCHKCNCNRTPVDLALSHNSLCRLRQSCVYLRFCWWRNYLKGALQVLTPLSSVRCSKCRHLAFSTPFRKQLHVQARAYV